MVRYFVMPQRDEAFYSLIARFKEHLNLSAHRLNATLFGQTNLKHNLLLSSNLSSFCDRVGKNFSLPYQRIHDNHTLLPLFKKFNQKFIDFEYLKNPIKLFSNRYLSRQEFKYCPACFEESYSIMGEPYWNRLHSIPYIQICLPHQARLEAWSPNIISMEKREIFPASIVSYKLNVRHENNPLVYKLTSETIDCLNNDFKPNLDDIIQVAKEKGILRKVGVMFKFNSNHHKPLNEFIKEATLNTGEDSLEILKSIRHMLFKTANTISPYSYLTLLTYIENSPKVMVIKKEKQYEPEQGLLRERKMVWENELKSVDFISIGISRIKLKTEYRWLLKKDPLWISAINKEYRVRSFSRTKPKPHIHRTDNQIVEDIKNKKESLIHDQVERQISKLLILSMPEFKFLTSSALDLLPKTSEYLNSCLETKFDFRKRKITKFMIDNQSNLPSKSEVLEKFKINHKAKYSNYQRVQLVEIVNRFYCGL